MNWARFPNESNHRTRDRIFHKLKVHPADKRLSEDRSKAFRRFAHTRDNNPSHTNSPLSLRRSEELREAWHFHFVALQESTALESLRARSGAMS